MLNLESPDESMLMFDIFVLITKRKHDISIRIKNIVNFEHPPGVRKSACIIIS